MIDRNSPFPGSMDQMANVVAGIYAWHRTGRLLRRYPAVDGAGETAEAGGAAEAARA